MPERIQRKRTKCWRMPENTVYVGRGTRWGNPFIVGREYESNKGKRILVKSREEAIALYRSYIERQLALKPNVVVFDSPIEVDGVLVSQGRSVPQLETLRGKNLACFCAEGKPCHADVLLELANKAAD